MGTKLSMPLAPPYRTSMLTYYETDVQLNPATGATASYVIRGNDLYDPNVTGTGKQPYNFDQWMTLYARFVVLWSQIEVWASTIDSNKQFTISLIPSISSSPPTTTDQVPEMPGVKSTIFTGYQMSKSLGYVKSQRKTKTVFGVKDVLDDIEFSGSAASSPAADNTWYWLIQVQGNDSTFDPSAITLTIKVKYIARFQQRNNLVSS